MAGSVCLVVLEDGQRKKVSLPSGAYSELMGALAVLTNIHGKTLIQMYDDELDDYVDLEEGSHIPQKAKIKLARKQDVQVDGASPAFTFVQNAGGTVEVAEQSGVTGSAQGMQSIQAVPLEKERDFLEFVLPSFGHYDEVLRRKLPINGAVRRAIVDKMFSACIKIAWYPSRQLYRVAAERLVTAHPHLADRVGCGSGLESWVMALRNKFKNTRKKLQNCSEEMLSRKKRCLPKQRQAPSEEVANKKLCRLFDCNHLTTYGETVESLQVHNEWLQNNAACHDEAAVRPRLRATALDRHQQLRSLTLSDALLLFPFLGTEALLLSEFDLVFQRSVVEEMQSGFRTLSYVILNYGEADEVAAFTETGAEDAALGALQFIAKRCNEPLDSILTQEQALLTPCLVRKEGGLELHIDKEPIFRVQSLLSGMACLFASFWVFHVEYPRKAHKMLTFLEHGFLHLKQTKPRVKALELINFFMSNVDFVSQL